MIAGSLLMAQRLIEAMIMGSVGPDETIIIPREAHRSVISGLVLSGAKPVYMDCQFDDRWGIPLVYQWMLLLKPWMLIQRLRRFFSVSKLFGVGHRYCKDCKEAHKRGMIVLVDEAYGHSFTIFLENLPVEAIAAGADLVAQSTHKSVGSLTQTSWLLGQGIKSISVVLRKCIKCYSTSPNYIFLASLGYGAPPISY